MTTTEDAASRAEEPYERTGGPVHGWFGLSYCNYLVLHRTFLQSMPLEWQQRFTGALEELDAAFGHVDRPGYFKVEAAEDHYVSEMTPEQLARAGIESEDGPCAEDHDHVTYEPPRLWPSGWLAAMVRRLLRRPWPSPDCYPGSVTYYDVAEGYREMHDCEHVMLPVSDPVPHYNRGRTYLPPDEAAIAAHRAFRAEYPLEQQP